MSTTPRPPFAPAASPLSRFPAVTVPMAAFVPATRAHYFCGHPTGRFTKRAFTFPGEAALAPLIRAFLTTAVADLPEDFRFVFTLLGGELAANAIEHTRSSRPGGSLRLLVHRTRTGVTLTCSDDGGFDDYQGFPSGEYLAPRSFTTDPAAETTTEKGRGLALVDALSTAWGDSGRPRFRDVWFRLDHDMRNSAWPTT
ncbi:ATP-binding protein [Actinorugispora endophytica]|uniref:Histidine kinase-like protein n=1 Tax=Actinorugispora endophytica TaxID=1605990 RepID=A0A4R6VA02_9ACTN|nr:ATP-binding protein [Actinorugispora endophytica]TDQ53356.1 histidine kinase-like protein [Actinorugispora endophytica]